MSTSDLHPEFDDEFLSAYLDNELAPEERERVEKWLADDPAARQLLDQLRSVSSAVHELPREAIGMDLTATVLQRAERAMLTSKTSASTVGGNGDAPAASLRDALDGYTVGRTRRGWIWAGAAIAAALLIAAFQMAPQNNAPMPTDVAMKSPEGLQRPTGEVEVDNNSTIDKATATDGTIAAKSPAFSEESTRSGGFASGGVGGGGAGGALAQNGGRAESSDRALSDLNGSVAKEGRQQLPDVELRAKAGNMTSVPPNAESPAPVFAGSGAPVAAVPLETTPATASAPTAMASKSAAATATESLQDSLAADNSGATNDVLVVHVTCSPEALRNNVFETTLKDSDIDIENAKSDPSKDKESPALQTDDTMAKQVARRSNAKVVDESGSVAQEPEVVVVDAPVQNVYKCLDKIDGDTKNFLNVAIDDKLMASQDVKDEARKRGRGNVSQQAQVQFTPENAVTVPTNRGRVELNRSSDYFDVARSRELKEIVQQKKAEQNLANRGRARYVEPQEQETVGRYYAGQPANEPAQQTPVANNERRVQLGYAFRGGEQKLDAYTPGNLQVLFMLWPSDQAATAAGDRPASSPPVESKVSK